MLLPDLISILCMYLYTSNTLSSSLPPPFQIKASSHFANDLGLDSLDTVEVVMAIEEEFSIEIPDKDADTIHSGKRLSSLAALPVSSIAFALC